MLTHDAIKAHVASAPAVTMDETGWRIGGRGAWLWVAATDDATVYDVAQDRDFDAATNLVPADYAGTVVRDGWVVYNSYKEATHQTCVAHLLRRCHEMIEDLPAWARGTPRQVRDLLLEALDARDLDAAGRATAVTDIGERFDLLFEQAHPHDANRHLIKHLRHERAALFTFLTIDGVDATNWRGEQGVRPAVVNRKVWGGNRSRPGGRDPGPVHDVPAHGPSAGRRCDRPAGRPGPGAGPRRRRRAHAAFRLKPLRKSAVAGGHSPQFTSTRPGIYVRRAHSVFLSHPLGTACRRDEPGAA